MVNFTTTGAGNVPAHLKVMVSGPPKSGKTTLLGTMPNILVLDTEPFANNMQSLSHKNMPTVTIENSSDLREVAFILGNEQMRKQLAQGTYGIPDIMGVAIDTLDTLQKILKAERLKENRTTQFLRDDWGWLKTEMEEIVQMFCNLPLHVVFVVHTKTKEMGKGDDAYTVVLPGLEGAISESIAGMVGYSLLSFRKEEIDLATGRPFTKYWLRTEGDATHDFLGTRTAGRLPSIIEPNMKTIYDVVMANRPAPPAPVVQPPSEAPESETPAASGATPTTDSPAPSADPSTTPSPEPVETPTAAPAPTSEPTPEPTPTPAAEPVAQESGQNVEQVQTPVETPVETPAPAATQPPAERPADDEPVTAAALGHMKRVYDALEVAFPEEILRGLNLGQARQIVTMWRGVMQDYAEGKGQEGSSANQEMLDYLIGQGWVVDDSTPEVEPEPEAKVDGNIAQIKAYIGNPPDLAKVQEAYDLEMQKGDQARATLVKKLEQLGAKPIYPDSAPAPQVQTAVESSPVAAPTEPAPEAVTPEPAAADAEATEAEAVQAVEQGLGGVQVITSETPCDVCGNKIDDVDLAELGKKRFDKILCVSDYLKQQQS